VLLAIVHVIGVPIYAWMAQGDLGRLFVVSGFWVSQTSLLGFWGATSTYSWKIRFPAVMMGIGYLSLLSCWFVAISMDRRPSLSGLPSIALLHCASFASVAIPFAVVRRFLARLERVANDAESMPMQRWKILLRDLLLLTFLIACVLGMDPLQQLLWQLESWMTPVSRWGRWLATISRREHSPGLNSDLLRYCLWSMPVVTIAVWATLGRRHVVLRNIVALGASLPAGFLVANVYGASPMMPSSVHAVSMIPEAFLVFASLWMVRLAGFRMVRVVASESRPKARGA